VLFGSVGGRRLTELAQLIGVHKSTTLRLLRTLVAEGFVRLDPESGHYTIAPALWFRAAPTLPAARGYEAAVRDLLQGLAEETGVTAVLFVPDPSYRSTFAIAWGIPSRLVRLDPAAGPPAPLNSMAAGKCFLAALSDEELGEWIATGLERLTPETITDPAALAAEIEKVRALGFATNVGESVSGTSGLAVPIQAGPGRPAAALSLAIAAPTFPEGDGRLWLGLLQTAAQALSALFSGSPPPPEAPPLRP
jgi:DNA-binding IclR family transcriptional regulator